MENHNEKQLLSRMERSLSGMTKAQRKVAEFILDNPMDAALMSIEKLAMMVDTSTSSIVRLALYMGFESFSDFMKSLQLSVKAKYLPSERLQMNIEENGKDNLFDMYYAKSQKVLSETYQKNSLSDLEDCTDHLSFANKIFVAGSRASYAIAHYFAYQCYRLRGNCYLLGQGDGSYIEHIHDAKENDVLLVFAFPRYPAKVVNMARWAKEQGAYVISLTDSFKSPVVEFSDKILLASTDSLGFQNAIVGTAFLTEYLLTSMSMKNETAVKNRLSNMENLLLDPDGTIYHRSSI